jgi:hypothetical protein
LRTGRKSPGKRESKLQPREDFFGEVWKREGKQKEDGLGRGKVQIEEEGEEEGEWSSRIHEFRGI